MDIQINEEEKVESKSRFKEWGIYLLTIAFVTVTLIVILALLGPVIGNVFSNVVSGI